MTELKNLKGVGEKRLAILGGMGIETPLDLLRFYPKKYIDFNAASDLSKVYEGEMCVFKCRLAASAKLMSSRKGVHYVQAELIAESGRLKALWFNNKYVSDALKTDVLYLFYGRVQVREGITLMNPQYKQLTENVSFQKLQPIYPLPPDITQTAFACIVSDALRCNAARSVIPTEILAGDQLMDINTAYALLHRPRDFQDVAVSSSRLALEEIVQLMGALKEVRNKSILQRFNEYPNRDLAPYLSALPFALTGAQSEAVQRIVAALSGENVMNLLLQGDVGSGKTAVAFAAMYLAAANGYQAVMMAPTEVLAKQHYRKAAEVFSRFGWGVCLLHGGMSASERRASLADIACGSSRIVIGTHAVFQKSVTYKNMSLVITDEQHRFGVRQRASLTEKSASADVLVMSATPIPRTLSLVMYGDMDVITLRDKPAGRREIKTSVVPDHKYEKMLGYIREQVQAGRQAFVICPMIDDDAESGKMSVERVYREYRGGAFKDIAVGYLHGGMKQGEKDKLMREFSENKLSVLVSTTVIEVGVDVPNATILVIYDADRFGLSQLHQLRGRVGRGKLQSYCFLLTGSTNERSLERLKILTSSNDGFEIAGRDFELRGSGELLGDRQSGFDLSVLRRVKFDGRVVERARGIFARIPFNDEYKRYFLQNCSSEYKNLLKVTL